MKAAERCWRYADARKRGILRQKKRQHQEGKQEVRFGIEVMGIYTNSFVTFLSWIYWLGTHAFNARSHGDMLFEREELGRESKGNNRE